MKKYFYIENDEQFGPFSIDELKEKKISKSTLIWTENLDNWTEAYKIKEIKNLVSSTPPPIPLKKERAIKVEAKITKKKEKLITPNTELLIAKETTIIFKFIILAIVIGIISSIYFISEKNGFSNKEIANKLQYDYDNIRIDNNTSNEERKRIKEDRQTLKNTSFNLGYHNYDKYSFCTSCAISYHKKKYEDAFKESISKSLIITLFSALVLIFSRYLFKSAKWVNKNSKREN